MRDALSERIIRDLLAILLVMSLAPDVFFSMMPRGYPQPRQQVAPVLGVP